MWSDNSKHNKKEENFHEKSSLISRKTRHFPTWNISEIIMVTQLTSVLAVVVHKPVGIDTSPFVGPDITSAIFVDTFFGGFVAFQDDYWWFCVEVRIDTVFLRRSVFVIYVVHYHDCVSCKRDTVLTWFVSEYQASYVLRALRLIRGTLRYMICYIIGYTSMSTFYS